MKFLTFEIVYIARLYAFVIHNFTEKTVNMTLEIEAMFCIQQLYTNFYPTLLVFCGVFAIPSIVTLLLIHGEYERMKPLH